MAHEIRQPLPPPQNPPGRQVNPRLTCTREGPRRSGLTRYFDEAHFKMGLAGGREESRGEGGRRPRPVPPGPRMGSTVIIPALVLPDRPHHGPSLEMFTGSPSARGGNPRFIAVEFVTLIVCAMNSILDLMLI